MLSNLLKNEIIELFNIKFNNECFKSKKIWVSKFEEIKLYVYQKGVDNGMKNIKVELDTSSLEELINIFKQQLKKEPTTKELLLIKEINNNIDKIYMEGFCKGQEIKEIIDNI